MKQPYCGSILRKAKNPRGTSVQQSLPPCAPPERGPCNQQAGPQEEQEQTQPPSLQPSRAKPAPTRVVPGLPVTPDRADESRVNRELVSMPMWQAISDNFDVPCAVRGHIQIAYPGNSMQQCAQKGWHVQRTGTQRTRHGGFKASKCPRPLQVGVAACGQNIGVVLQHLAVGSDLQV